MQLPGLKSRAANFAVPVLDHWLVHLPLHGVTALVNEVALRELCAPRLTRPDEHGFLASLRESIAAQPARKPEPKSGEFDPSMLVLVTTRGCNINCAYCDFGGPTAKKVYMDPAVAVSAIDWMADRLVDRGRDLFFLHLFGGEPLIAGDLVDLVVRRVRDVCARKGLASHVDVSTNGVMSAERARWVGESVDSVVLSMDGPPELQNRNRPGNNGRETFRAVDRTARYLSTTPVELCLRACVTRESVLRMPEITRWMIESYRPSVINFEPLTENDLTATAGLESADPFDYARMWMASKRVADRHGVRLVYSATESELPRLSSCPVGSDAVVVTPDGAANGCYLQPGDWEAHEMDMTLGRVVPGRGVEVAPERVHDLRHMILDKPRCSNCLAQWACAGGCHVSNTYRGSTADYTEFCVQTRLITACLLLEELGEIEVLDDLLNDREAMGRLANHRSDVLRASKENANAALCT